MKNKNKLVLIFDEDSYIDGMKKAYSFSNEQDAEQFFMGHQGLSRFRTTSYSFIIDAGGWSATGTMQWVTEIS